MARMRLVAVRHKCHMLEQDECDHCETSESPQFQNPVISLPLPLPGTTNLSSRNFQAGSICPEAFINSVQVLHLCYTVHLNTNRMQVSYITQSQCVFLSDQRGQGDKQL